jgi:hypothetical protein
MVGYSGTPLWKKLGIKDRTEIYISNGPENYFELITPLPAGVKIVPRLARTTDLVHLFVTERARLAKQLSTTLTKLKPAGVIWVSWPKRSSKVPTDITEDTIREVALPLGLVDIKVCSVDDTWSGLKLMIRKENRKEV